MRLTVSAVIFILFYFIFLPLRHYLFHNKQAAFSFM
jgi:hypothetical protein